MLQSYFFDSAENQPDSPALWVDERLYSYGEIETRARRVSAGLAALGPSGNTGRCLLFGHRSVDVYVRRLREKIESDPENPLHLKTVRGAGYLFETRAA